MYLFVLRAIKGEGSLSLGPTESEPHLTRHPELQRGRQRPDWNLSFTENTGPQPIQIFGNKCIEVKDGVNADGTNLQIATCLEGDENQQWIFIDSTLQWHGTNKCIYLPDDNLVDGNLLEISACGSNNPEKKWIAQPSQLVTPHRLNV
ncbi:hypothetical protein C8R45DRAFT_1162104 [Mycena sanguinolenta]|nr:hypothetical protein C8R45DRAFT_1162104 [Mycena sanguinolenta]